LSANFANRSELKAEIARVIASVPSLATANVTSNDAPGATTGSFEGVIVTFTFGFDSGGCSMRVHAAAAFQRLMRTAEQSGGNGGAGGTYAC
jgi:hypothetical protein